MTKILVTGGLGFIGSNLVPELITRGHEVWVCDLGHSEGPNYIRCDVAKFRQLERVFEQQHFDYVYHLAAEYGRWNGEDYYENLWLTNVIGTKNMIRLQEKKRFRMIFFSSAEVYGDYDGIMSEDVMDKVPLKQMNDYAMTKWVGELQVLNSAAMFGTETVRVRPVNAYGPHEYYSPYRGVIPAFIYKALTWTSQNQKVNHNRSAVSFQ
jgi:dTDP-glucose 4,6-dehydratase